jgi:hypothetical protein
MQQEQLTQKSQEPWYQGGFDKPYDTRTVVFLAAGLMFLGIALILFVACGYVLYQIALGNGVNIQVPEPPALPSGSSEERYGLSDREIANYTGKLIAFATAPILLFLSAIICAFIGIRLLRSAGAVTTQEVIPARDYDLIAGAIKDGNEKAVSEYIRLRSLAGFTGNFTKIGLTGLPLATIVKSSAWSSTPSHQPQQKLQRPVKVRCQPNAAAFVNPHVADVAGRPIPYVQSAWHVRVETEHLQHLQQTCLTASAGYP